MAENLRHAAAGQPTYEVHELAGTDELGDLGVRRTCSSYLAAVEYAFEYLGRTDPLREGKVEGLDVVRVEGNRRDSVWTYRYESAPPDRQSLVGLWGFDVSRNWHGPPRPAARPQFSGRRYRSART